MHICRTNDKFKQVRVDDSQYDANTLPAFAAERRRMQLSIEISCPQGAQQQTRRCCCRSIVKSDGRTPTLYGPCSTYYVSSVISKAVTRGVFWVFEHTREFQVKIRHTKRNYTSFTFYAFYKLGNAPKSVSAGALPRTPLGKLTALPQTPSWWGGGSPRPTQEPYPLLGPSGFGNTGYAVSSPTPPENKS